MSNDKKYKIYIAIPGYKAGTTVVVKSPIESLFAPTPPYTGSKFGNSVMYVNEPILPLIADTKIGTCGRRGCDGCDETHTVKVASPDYEIFKSVLEDWNDDTTQGAVILKTSTIGAGVTLEALAGALTSAEEKLKDSSVDLDIFYFAKWLDRADQFNVLETLQGGGKVVRTWSPHGFQAIAITSTGMQKLATAYPPATNPVVCRPFSQVINSMIQKGTFVAATTTPSLLQYDSTLISVRSACGTPEAPFSFLKASEVRGDTHPERFLNRRISADLSLFWIVIIIIVALITSFILVKIGGIVSAYAP